MSGSASAEAAGAGPSGARAPLRARAVALLRRRGPLALGILLLALASWPFATLTPGIDGDANWAAALAYIAKHRLVYADQLVWTYGPLGFMTQPPLLYYGDVAIVMVAYQWVVQVLLVGTIFLALRRSFPLLVAIAVTLAVPAFVPDRTLALGFAWCALVLLRRDGPRDRLLDCFAPAVGAIAGILLLSKLNHGVEMALLAPIALVAMPHRRRRDVLLFAGALVATAGIGWLATGQALDDVWPYLRYGKEEIAGYPAAMGLDAPSAGWNDYAAALLVALAAALVWSATRAFERRRRWGVWLLCAIYAYFNYKAGFVRRDSAHTVFFVGDMLVLLLVVPVTRERRPLALASMATSMVLFAAVHGSFDLTDAIDPRLHVQSAADEARLLASSDRRGAAKSALAQSARSYFAVPARLVALLADRTTAAWPYSLGTLVYAYDLDWRPPPALEPYSAYTPALDRLDARMLASSRAPERILRSTVPPIDGRFAGFEAPLATLQLLCRYREIGVAARWQVLARGQSRCGEARPLAVVEARWGEDVTVPAARDPRSLVVVRIEGANPRGLEQARSLLLLRPSTRSIVLDGTGYRLIAATAADGLLVHAPADADWRKPFAVAPNAETIAVHRTDGDPDGRLRYVFEQIPIAPLPAGARR